MDITVLTYIFNLSIIIGLLIPLISAVSGWLGGLFGGGGADVSADVDIDLGADTGAEASPTDSSGHFPIPFDLMCLCLGFVVFGAMGRVFMRQMTSTLTVILMLSVCVILALAAYVALYKLIIERLRKNKATTISYSNLNGKPATVTLKISRDAMGTVSLPDSTGANISFRAKIDPDLADYMPESIEQDEPVVITDVDEENKFCYVSVYKSRFIK